MFSPCVRHDQNQPFIHNHNITWQPPVSPYRPFQQQAHRGPNLPAPFYAPPPLPVVPGRNELFQRDNNRFSQRNYELPFFPHLPLQTPQLQNADLFIEQIEPTLPPRKGIPFPPPFFVPAKSAHEETSNGLLGERFSQLGGFHLPKRNQDPELELQNQLTALNHLKEMIIKSSGQFKNSESLAQPKNAGECEMDWCSTVNIEEASSTTKKAADKNKHEKAPSEKKSKSSSSSSSKVIKSPDKPAPVVCKEAPEIDAQLENNVKPPFWNCVPYIKVKAYSDLASFAPDAPRDQDPRFCRSRKPIMKRPNVANSSEPYQSFTAYIAQQYCSNSDETSNLSSNSAKKLKTA